MEGKKNSFVTPWRVSTQGVKEGPKGTKKESFFSTNSPHNYTCSVRVVPYGIPGLSLDLSINNKHTLPHKVLVMRGFHLLISPFTYRQVSDSFLHVRTYHHVDRDDTLFICVVNSFSDCTLFFFDIIPYTLRQTGTSRSPQKQKPFVLKFDSSFMSTNLRP